uniref:glucose-6-phosphate 1-epimerase n=2 Tax=Lygus hesperus TaxID=30085 RepID=A0A0A9W6P5_LYGHE
MMLWLFFIALAVKSGRADDVVILKKDGAEASIHRHGATVISWKVDGRERLFLSAASKLDGSSHIMGGVPIVFPKFADWGPDRPFHGFARISRWDLVKAQDGKAVFELKDSEVTRGYWNHSFHLEYSVTLEPKQLRSALRIINSSPTKFDFEVLYHTFIRVQDVRNISLSGLQGLKYKDKTRNFDEFTETRDVLKIQGFTDSVYQNTPKIHNITNTIDGQTLELKKSGLPDLTVWNPWSEEIKTFSDLEPNEWTDFVCAEAGHVFSQIELLPGCDYEASQTLSIL